MYKWFGIPSKIISDQDPQFTSHFSTSLCQHLGINQNISTAYYPQTDGLSERKNQWVEQYLRLMTSSSQDDWSDWLSIATAVHNNYPNATTHITPIEALFVTKPPSRTSRTALRRPIRFLLRRPNRCQDRRSLGRSFPENLITCIVTPIPYVTHHVQSSRDSRLSRFHEVSELLSQPPPVSIRKTYSHTHNSRAAQ